MRTLSDVDRRAVDLFLESRSMDSAGPSNGNGLSHNGGESRPAVGDPQVEERLARVSELLELLNRYEVADPPASLVARVILSAEASKEPVKAPLFPPAQPPNAPGTQPPV